MSPNWKSWPRMWLRNRCSNRSTNTKGNCRTANLPIRIQFPRQRNSDLAAMRIRELLFGRPLRTEEEQIEQIGPLSGVPVLGLDALASASYGPEAALTVLLPLGLASAGYIAPITVCILLVLGALFFSYRQTIQAYPQGGGSFTVAKENLGTTAG